MKLLKIYLNNTDKINGETLWHKILEKVNESNLKGATVYKAIAGVGKHKEIHTFELLNLSIDIPIIIEIIDEENKIKEFLESSKEFLKETFVTISEISVAEFE